MDEAPANEPTNEPADEPGTEEPGTEEAGTDELAGEPGNAERHGRHELPPHRRRELLGPVQGRRSRLIYGALGVALCVLLGVAIVTQVRHTESRDSLETARPADLLVLLDSLQQREATLNTEVSDLQHTLAGLQASGSGDQAAIANAQAKLAALSILIGTVAATGPGVTLTITDTAPGVTSETLLDVVNELRAAGAEAIEIRGGGAAGTGAVRVGADTWVAGTPGALAVDNQTLSPPYSVLAIGDPPTLAAAMNIPGGAVDSVERVGATMTVGQAARVDVTALREAKPHQYAQPVK